MRRATGRASLGAERRAGQARSADEREAQRPRAVQLWLASCHHLSGTET